MINTIKNILSEENIDTYLITETISDSAELFLIRRTLDAKRTKSVRKYEVVVYRDFEKDGARMRGSSLAYIFPSMEKEEIARTLRDAYYAASFVCNPYFELPDKATGDGNSESGLLSSMSLEKSAEEAARSLYSAKESEKTFINSAEIFSCCVKNRICSSNGTDVRYTKHSLSGEFVVQCTENEDVEFYSQFEYDDLDIGALAEKAQDALSAVRARSNAERCLKSGKYTVIIDKEHLAKLLSYYLNRANAANIYAKYSDYKIGEPVQGDSVSGRLLNIDVCPSAPYSDEGIPMEERALIKDGKLLMIHGNTRFCRYLGETPKGTYKKIRLDSDGVSLDDMKKEPYLYVVKFSDFSMDKLSGHFGGEIRLAYLFDGNETHIITGGSINGLITDAQKDFEFSTEKYRDSKYEGPLAVRIRDINVAGC